jgi:hypothetical protein
MRKIKPHVGRGPMQAGFGSYIPPEHQAVATLDQAAPVNGTFYTVLDTTQNCRILIFAAEIATTGETIEGKITIDGNAITVTAAAFPADTPYWCIISADPGVGTFGPYWNNAQQPQKAWLIEGRSVKLEVKKTTAAGVGNLKGLAVYQTW